MDKTTSKHTLPITLNASNFDTNLLTAPKTLKDFVHQYCHKKENFDLKGSHTNMDPDLLNKIFFFNNLTIDVFSVCCCDNFTIGYDFSNVHTVLTYALKMLEISIALQQIKEAGAVARQKDIMPNIA